MDKQGSALPIAGPLPGFWTPVWFFFFNRWKESRWRRLETPQLRHELQVQLLRTKVELSPWACTWSPAPSRAPSQVGIMMHCHLHDSVSTKLKHILSSASLTDVSAEAVGVSVGAPPTDGEANTELIRYLADVLDLKKSQISLSKVLKPVNVVLWSENSRE